MFVYAEDEVGNKYFVGNKIEYNSPTFGKVNAQIIAIACRSKPRITIAINNGRLYNQIAIYNLKNVSKLP